MHQYSNCVLAPILHVPFLHQVPPEPDCLMCPLPGSQGGGTAQKTGACNQSGSHAPVSQSAAVGYQLRSIFPFIHTKSLGH